MKIEADCRLCGGKFPVEVTLRGGKELRWSRPTVCPDCEAKQAAEDEAILALQDKETREGWKRSCGIPRSHWGKTFESFKATGKVKIVKTIRSWIESFPTSASNYPSMILYSAISGLGKTHLAAAAGNLLIDRWPGSTCPVRLVSGPTLLDRIYDSYKSGATEKKSDILYDLRGARLLILDDVGKMEKPSDHTRGCYYEVIEGRIEVGWPLMLTTNLPLRSETGKLSLLDLMGPAAVSRLIGMSKRNFYELRGRDWREEHLEV